MTVIQSEAAYYWSTAAPDGIVVTSKEFVDYFIREKTKVYLRTYLPSVSIEPGRYVMSHNKYLFKIGRGQFRLHGDVIAKHKNKHMNRL